MLFDLDGTLLDTAPDLAFALNQVRSEQGLAPLPYAEIRPRVSHGGSALVEFGFGLSAAEPEFAPLRQRLLDIYRNNLSRETRLFPGMPEVLQSIEQRGMNWGVVTNKPAYLTEPLLQALNLYDRAACVISGDTLEQRKPHAAPMLIACQQAGSKVVQCVYVGDAQRDVEAGRNAGMRTLVAMFGYCTAEDKPDTWGADALIYEPADVLHWLDQQP